MKKRSISLIIGLMSFALLGVMTMQYYFIKESYNLKLQLFDQSVNSALKSVAAKLEKRDALNFLNHKANKLKSRKDRIAEQKNVETLSPAQYDKKIKQLERKIDFDFRYRDSLLKTRYPKALMINNNIYETYFRDNPGILNNVSLNVKTEKYTDIYGRVFEDESREFYLVNVEKRKLIESPNLPDSIHYLVTDPTVTTELKVIAIPTINRRYNNELVSLKKEKKSAVERRRREDQVRQVKSVTKLLDSEKTQKPRTAVFEDLAMEYEQFDVPFIQRINAKMIDSLLREELFTRGISSPYSYKITVTNPDSVVYTKISDGKNIFENEDTYRTALFPQEMVRQSGVLSIFFPYKTTLILKNMNVVMGSSIALILVLISCFTYTILIIIRQKKISEMKTDFINNMTHEFKTPVSTIMIASEALTDPDVVEDGQRVKRLAGIIYDENVRLGNHIERVLNIARIDREDLRLDHKNIDIHELISLVVDSMELQLVKRNVKLSLQLDAERAVISGDELHLSNVIFNLIDNAIKYSNEDPEISITTYNSGKDIVISIADKGIGMNRDQLSKIFDQFYRVPTGNLHNVKGFGLGLNYVQTIVKQLHGSIKVKSEKDKGSVFDITFSTIKNLP